MSSNHRDGDQFNDTVKHKCTVCGYSSRRPLFKSGEAYICSFKCYDEFREVSNAVADLSDLTKMSVEHLMAEMEACLKEREELHKERDKL